MGKRGVASALLKLNSLLLQNLYEELPGHPTPLTRHSPSQLGNLPLAWCPSRQL